MTSSTKHRERGSTLVEFSLVALTLFAVMFGAIEMNRMILVYATVADSARAGARYAIVHGSDRTGSGLDGGASGPGNDPASVVTIVKNFAGGELPDTTRLVVRVRYLDASNDPGSRVTVTTIYPYDPFTSFFPLSVNLGSISEGVIAF